MIKVWLAILQCPESAGLSCVFKHNAPIPKGTLDRGACVLLAGVCRVLGTAPLQVTGSRKVGQPFLPAQGSAHAADPQIYLGNH